MDTSEDDEINQYLEELNSICYKKPVLKKNQILPVATSNGEVSGDSSNGERHLIYFQFIYNCETQQQ